VEDFFSPLQCFVPTLPPGRFRGFFQSLVSLFVPPCPLPKWKDPRLFLLIFLSPGFSRCWFKTWVLLFFSLIVPLSLVFVSIEWLMFFFSSFFFSDPPHRHPFSVGGRNLFFSANPTPPKATQKLPGIFFPLLLFFRVLPHVCLLRDFWVLWVHLFLICLLITQRPFTRSHRFEFAIDSPPRDFAIHWSIRPGLRQYFISSASTFFF